MDLVTAVYDKNTKIWSGKKMAPLYNIEHHSVGKILYGQMKIYPNKVIQIDDFDGKAATNQDVLTWAKRIALHFKKLRMRHDDIVGIAARNTTYLTPVALACFFNGTPFHGVNPNFQEATIAHCFNITKPQIIFCDGRDYAKISAATKSFKPKIYTLSEHMDGVPSVVDLLQPRQDEYFYQPEELTLGADQTVAIIGSSGTTGLPKAVNISAHKLALTSPFLTSEDVIYTSSALDWMSGLMVTIFSLCSGCTRIITRKPFTAEYFIELVQKYKITSITIAPIHVVALSTCPQFNSKTAASIRSLNCGGGYISKQTLAQVQSVIPSCIICFGYGLTEAGGVSGYFGLERGNSVGKLMPNIQLRITDDDGKNLAPNSVGEILVRYPHHWTGYYGNPIETQRIFDSLGWFHSGDLGYMDEDGFLFVVDRKKDILKYQAQQYWPSEIENVVRELTGVVDCCVVGIFDERFGDVAGALVIRQPGSRLSEQQIVSHVKERLVEPQKQLHNGVHFVDQLPQNLNGKVVKREAKQLFQSLMKLDR